MDNLLEITLLAFQKFLTSLNVGIYPDEGSYQNLLNATLVLDYNIVERNMIDYLCTQLSDETFYI